MQGMMAAIIVFLAAIAVFVFQNTAPVTIRFVTWQSPKISIALVALAGMLVGCLFTLLINGSRYLMMGKKVRELERKNLKLEKQVKKLAMGADSLRQAGATVEDGLSEDKNQ